MRGDGGSQAPRKRIVICIDGTWCNFYNYDTRETVHWSNVHKIRACIAERDSDIAQITLYSRGVGTSNYFQRVLGTLFAEGINEQVLDAYMSLCDIYEEGDEIYLVGFSRGAVAVRALAGMIIRCGLLKSSFLRSIDRAWNYFVLKSEADRQRDEFNERRNIECYLDIPIKAIAVWDTVEGLKILENKRSILGFEVNTKYSLAQLQFETPQLHSRVENAFQALAISEQRKEFQPIIWTSIAGSRDHSVNVKQVWFPGVHASVGGGYEDQGISDIALDWMIRNLREAGLKFHENVISDTVKPNICARFYDSSKGWIGESLERQIELDPEKFIGEKVHSSALALFGNKLPLADYSAGAETFLFAPKFIEDRGRKIKKSLIEDLDLLESYYDQLATANRINIGKPMVEAIDD